MSGQHEDLLRRLGTAGVPVPSAEVGVARRERMVGAIGRAIRKSAVRRERRTVLRRAGAALGVAAALAFTALAASGLRLERASGDVELVRAGVEIGAEPGVFLAAGEWIKTERGARAELATEKSQIVLHEAGELAFGTPNAHKERVVLRSGRVDVSVDARVNPGRLVVVETPDAEVVVRGTRFDVRVEPGSGGGNVTNVSVVHGTVAIMQRGAVVATLTAGERWSSRLPVLAPIEPPHEHEQARRAPPPQPVGAARGPVSPPSGTLAEENRLFQEALEARNRGEHARAVDAFGRLLGRYPRSVLAEEAQAERFRGLRRLKQTARAAAEARRYLAQYPNGFAAQEARELALEPSTGER
jgi:hypothetical protein